MTAFFVLLPHGISQFGAVVRLYRRHQDAVWIGGTMVSMLYLLTFTNTHPYNFLPWWLHNKVVLLATSSPGWKLAFLVPILYQVLVFVSTPLWRRELYLFYPLAVVYLAASWLIEPRYFFIPLLLFIMFRKPGRQWVEVGLVAWNAVLGLVLFWGVWHGLWLP